MEEENDFNFQENNSLDLLNNIFNTEEEEKLDKEEQTVIGPVAIEVKEPQQIIEMVPEFVEKPNVYSDNFVSNFLNKTNPEYNEQLNRGDYDVEERLVPVVITIGNPKENPFYIKTQEILNEISEIQKNPLKFDYSTISVGDQVRTGLVNEDKSLALDFKDTQAIDVEGTMNQINKDLEELPKI